MPTETKIQAFIHKLEEGGWAKGLKIVVLVVAVLATSYLWLFGESGFKGLVHPRAFEAAIIAREFARGNGFTTKVFRPASLFQFREYKGTFPVDRTPDTYHAPVWPIVISPAVWAVRESWKMSEKDVLYPSDRMVATMSTLCFLLAVLVNYFLARRLFDHRLAILALGLLLVCDLLWRFSMTGLPQMLMLLLFSCGMYMLLRAVEIHEHYKSLWVDPDSSPASRAPIPPPPESVGEENSSLQAPAPPQVVHPAGTHFHAPLLRGPLPWLVGTALFFSILALTHGITIWIFAALLVFCLIYFRPVGLYAGIMLAIFVMAYSPWLVRNYRVTGMPFGVSWYSGLHQIRGSEDSIMRSMDPPLSGVSPGFFKRKIVGQVQSQLRDLYGHLGGIVVAPFFFIALLHLFRRRATATFRWVVLLCWLAALLGMSVFGLDDRPYQSNDIHVLFIPLMTFYGLGFVLVLWSRLDIRVRLVQIAFTGLIFVLSGYPFLFSMFDLLSRPTSRVEWPPYIPPYIAVLGNWTAEREVIMSDMPWAVAWYADRRSLWLPTTVDDFLQLNDWDVLQGRIVGLHLTPVSGDSPFLSTIVKGEFKEWAPFIMRNANLRNFPLKAVTPLPIDNMCVFYADRDRWNMRED